MARRPFPLRNMIIATHDALAAAMSFIIALWLRLGEGMTLAAPYLLPGVFLFTAICVGIFTGMRLYRGMWRYVSLQDLIRIGRAATLACLVFIGALFMLTRLEGYPRAALMINWLLLIVFLGGPRFLYRLLRDGGPTEVFAELKDKRVPVLLVGANDNAELFLRETSHRKHSNYRVVGIIDDEPQSIGRQMRGVRIYGPMEALEAVVKKLERKKQRPHKMIFSDPHAKGAAIRDLVTRADALGLSVARLPRLSELSSQMADSVEVQPIAVEDLLGRPQHAHDLTAVKELIRGHRVLITGAGGSIGSELVRQVAAAEPAEIILLDHSEYALYRIDRTLHEQFIHVPRRAILADVRDREHIQHLFKKHRPELVFHAAALKHVPLAEDNPAETIQTNLCGTRNIADAACEHKALAMVMISTDKAVHPTNIMGASKRLAEHYCHALGASENHRDATRIVTVRFGNVLGSTGSVVPLFRQQIAQGGPVTITDPRMVRYFMTIREAVELVLEATSEATRIHERNGFIFVLDMGKPMRIEDLARQMIRLAGLEPDKDIEIRSIGIRPGEKMYEELFYPAEAPVPTEKEGILLASSTPQNIKTLRKGLDALIKRCQHQEEDKLREQLHKLLPEYQEDAG